MDITAARLANQFLVGSKLKSAAQVVSALGAVQAQEYDRAKWALGLRMASGVDRDVEQAMTDGSILRTHVLRPTWHFVAPADIRWMLALTGPRVSERMAPYNRHLELDTVLFRRSRAAIIKALRDGQQLTRQELRAELERAKLNVDGTQRLAHVMMQAELDGVICSGARRGKQFTYGLLDERVPSAAPLDRDEALQALTVRYFTTRGPATPQDFSWWSGLTVVDARRGIEAAGRALEHVVVEGKNYWIRPDSRTASRKSANANTFLLPVYDEYFIAYRDRSAAAPHLDARTARSLGDSLFDNMVVRDGRVVASWNRAFTKQGVTVELRHLSRPTRLAKSAIAAAAERYGAFFEKPVELRGQG